MLIQCTKKLLTELKIKPVKTNVEEDPLFSWHANLITFNRRKTLVLTNDSNRYIIILHGLKAKNFQKIDEVIKQAIAETFREEKIKDEVIEAFLSHKIETTFTATKNRTLVARMNKACENVLFSKEEEFQPTLTQPILSKHLSRLLVGDGKNSYLHPNEQLYQDLEKWMGGPIFNSQALIVHVTLTLENHNVWRRIALPKMITFSELHQTLQIAFDWNDSHLYQFQIYEGKPVSLDQIRREENRKPVVTLVNHKELLGNGHGDAVKMETGERLIDYLPAEVIYIYDFGDDWKHRIVVEGVSDDFDRNHPICLGGEGNAPPEDVGGEPGYEHFLATINDKDHPDFSEFKHWGSIQGYREFNMENVNRRLGSV